MSFRLLWRSSILSQYQTLPKTSGDRFEKIKNEEGKDIWLFGGAGLTTSLMNLGLIDELSLAIHPILLGDGKPLFKNITDRINLTRLDSKSFSSGLVSLTYSLT